jgi:hypothetical protein
MPRHSHSTPLVSSRIAGLQRHLSEREFSPKTHQPGESAAQFRARLLLLLSGCTDCREHRQSGQLRPQQRRK